MNKNIVNEDHSSNTGQEYQVLISGGESVISCQDKSFECVRDLIVNTDNSLSDVDENQERFIATDQSTGLSFTLRESCLITNCEHHFSPAVQDNDPKLSNYIYQILNSDYEGQFLLATYEFEENEENYEKLLETKKTTYFSKWKVARIIVNHEFHRTNSLTITPDRFDQLALEASKLFPSYFKESFYTRSSKTKGAGGVLQSYYANQREKETAIGRIKVSNRKKRKNPENTDESLLSEGLKDLQNSVQIIDDKYKKKWASTALEERIFFYKGKEIPEIFETFPNLANPTGYSLVQADFETFFKKGSDVFEKKWSEVATKVIKFAKKKKATDECIKEILNNNSVIQNEERETLTLKSEHRQTLALILLPYLFRKITKQTVRSKTKSPWNPEKKEVLQTFIFHIESTENFNDLLKNASKQLLEMHNSHKLKVQPFIVINGPTLNNISSAYVILDKFKYQVSTTTVAVNLCFQCMKVFQEKYSSVCNHLWQFLESEVYGMNVEDPYSSVVTLKENLRKC